MKSPEERAREIAQNLFGHPRWNRQPDALEWRDVLAQEIATALREAQNERDEVWKRRLVDAVVVAQNEAYERAAGVAERIPFVRYKGDFRNITGTEWARLTGEEIAAAIRSLKDTSPSQACPKDDTTS